MQAKVVGYLCLEITASTRRYTVVAALIAVDEAWRYLK